MLPRCFLNEPRIILWTLIFHELHHCWKVCPCFGWSRSRGEKCWIPSESILKMIIINVENCSFDELGQEISLIKRIQIMRNGGTPPGQSGGHRQPGGECFAPWYMCWSLRKSAFLHDFWKPPKITQIHKKLVASLQSRDGCEALS